LLVDPNLDEVVVLSLSASIGINFPREKWNLGDLFESSGGTMDAGNYALWRGPIDPANPPAATDVGGPFLCENGAAVFEVGLVGQHCWGPQPDVPYSLDVVYPITTPGIHTGYLGVATGAGTGFALTYSYSLIITCGDWFDITQQVCPPANVGLPAITGTPAVGQTLSASTGVWTEFPTSYTYQWQRCTSSLPSSCSPIGGATASQYVIKAADVGKYLTVEVGAANAGGWVPSRPDPSILVS
jgi:hypothetical protein